MERRIYTHGVYSWHYYANNSAKSFLFKRLTKKNTYQHKIWCSWHK